MRKMQKSGVRPTFLAYVLGLSISFDQLLYSNVLNFYLLLKYFTLNPGAGIVQLIILSVIENF